MLDFYFSLLLSPAAFAAFVAALYWIYPSPLIHGYKRFGGYIFAGLRRKFIKVGDISYCYYEREPVISASDNKHEKQDADPPKTLLFVHGFTGNKTMWMLMVKYLPKEWRLVLVDLPGHGETTFEPNAGYCATGLTAKLHEFIETMGLQNLHLVGCSLGALVSATYAAMYPHSVKSAVLMCPPGVHKLSEGLKTQFIEAFEKGDIQVMPKNGKEFQEMMELVLYYPGRFTFHNRMREALVQAQLPNYPHFSKIRQDMLDKQESEEYIKNMMGKIAAPVLILWGEHDKVCHPSGASVLSEFIKDSQVTMLEKCGHAMTLDHPRKCAKLVNDFIAKKTVNIH